MVEKSRKPKSRLRRWLRWPIRLTLGFLLCGLLYFGAVFGLGAITVNADYTQPARGVEIHVWSNGLHTDLLLPVRHELFDWREFAPLAGEHHSWMKNVLIGWGDHDFYIETRTDDDFSWLVTSKAILLPTQSVMHLQYRWDDPVEDEKCVRLVLRESEYQKLVEMICATFEFDGEGRPIMIEGVNYTPEDVFYRAVGTYHLFNTCNNWTNTMLADLGVRTAYWSPLDYAIFDHLPRD